MFLLLGHKRPAPVTGIGAETSAGKILNPLIGTQESRTLGSNFSASIKGSRMECVRPLTDMTPPTGKDRGTSHHKVMPTPFLQAKCPEYTEKDLWWVSALSGWANRLRERSSTVQILLLGPLP